MKRLAWSATLILAVAACAPAWAQQQDQQPTPPPPAATAPPTAPNAKPTKSYSGGVNCGDDHKCKPTGNGQGFGPDSYPSFSPSDLQQNQPPKSQPKDDNPFPEAQSKAAQDEVQKPPATAPKSGPKDYSDSADRWKDMNLLGDDKPRTDDGAGHAVLDPKAAAQDDKVGRFYLQSGDYAGAYARFKEAAQINPGDAEAVIGLAEAAEKVGKPQEAIQNYQVYLDAFPHGPKSKDARKALDELKAGH